MNHVASIDEQYTVRLVRDLSGPIERVWAYLTEPKHLAKWLSGGVFSSSVGGEVRLDMGAEGRITIFEPPHLLEYTWNEPNKSRGAILDTLVRWELAEVDGRVRLTLTHVRLSPSEAISHAAGWDVLTERLSASLEGGDVPDFMQRFERVHDEYTARYDSVS